jgi:hypothetical protein
MMDGVGPVPPEQDRLARLLRGLQSDAHVRAGVFVGVATLALTWLGSFILGLIPIPLFQMTMLAPYAKSGTLFNYRWWTVWSLLGHFGGSVHLTLGANASFLSLGAGSLSANLTGLVPLVILFGVMALVGTYARHRLVDSLSARLRVLLSASLTMALIAAVVALFGGYTIASTTILGSGTGGSLGTTYAVSFGAFSFLLRAFVMTLLIGAFTLGVVELLPVPHRAALKGAARFALWPALVAALVLPFIVGAYGVRLAQATNSSGPGARTAFMGAATLISPAAGAAIVPMSLGTQATVGVSNADLGILDNVAGVAGLSSLISSGNIVGAIKSFSAGRIFKYADYLGIKGKLGALVIVIVVLTFWVSAVGKYVAVMGSPTGRLGLRAGAYFGLISGLLVALLALLLTLHVNVGASALGQGATIDLAAGITGLSYVYVLLALTVVGAGVGYWRGALRPTPMRYTLTGITSLIDRVKVATPARYKSALRDIQSRAMVKPPVTAGAVAVAQYCSSCGAQFFRTETNFCPHCGTQRPVAAATFAAQTPPVPAAQTAVRTYGANTVAASPTAPAITPQRAAHPAGFCRKCGAAHRDASARFCVSCGAARVGGQ